MIKKTLNYTDAFDEARTDTLYFHLNQYEWFELEAFTKGGLMNNLQNAIETENNKKALDILKKIILTAYGEKNPENGQFEKDEDKAIRFSKSEAFSVLFMELLTNPESTQEFFLGLVPKEVRAEAEKKLAEQTGEIIAFS